MAAPNASPAGYLYFPQIDAERVSDSGKVISRAVIAFCQLIGIETTNGVVENPLITAPPRLFDLNLLLKAASSCRVPLYVFGTFTTEQAAEHSWEELGLNLFDLPWFSPAEEKTFRYIQLLALPKHTAELNELFAGDTRVDQSSTCQKVAEQLRWGQCHQFTGTIQRSVGHGVRDRLQLESETWENIRASVRSVLVDPRWSNLPCDDHCGLRGRASELAARPKEGGEQERLSFARKIAALDCRDYRYAPAIYSAPAPRPDPPQFDRIVILDDNVAFRRELKEALKDFLTPSGGNTPDDRIVEADPRKSWELYQLADADGKSIIEGFKDAGVKGSRILACFDLDINRANAPQSANGTLADVFGGQWVMYGTASAHPDVPRMVVTGFRSQDVLGFASGGGAYLLKPFTEEALEEEIRRAAVTRRVRWLCPLEVQDEYSRKLGGKAAFRQYADWLAGRLYEEKIEVEVMEEIVDREVAKSDLVIVDSCCASDYGSASKPLAAIAAVRSVNPRASLLLVIPADDSPQDITADYYRGLPLALRNGADAVIKKPTWIVGAPHHDPEDALSSSVIEQLSRLYDFDVKYQILVPVVGVVGRFDDAFIERVQAETVAGSEDILYAPILPHLIEVYGLSGRISEVVDSEGDVALLEEKLKSAPDRNPDRWAGVGDGTVAKTLVVESMPKIRAALSSKAIRQHRSFEVWLRKVVDEKARSAFGTIGINPLTEPLTRVFGGATRYEFGARGSWYKNIEQRVDDMLIVVEFCAKSSIIAKRFIETTVVNYLVKVAGEYCVMVQEIPIRGYLRG